METILDRTTRRDRGGVYTAVGAQVAGRPGPLVAIEPAGDAPARPAVVAVAS